MDKIILKLKKYYILICLFFKRNIIKVSKKNAFKLSGRIKKNRIKIEGFENTLEIRKGAKIVNCNIKIKGKKNKLVICENCKIRNSDILLDTENGKVIINKKTTISGIKIDAQEPYLIEIGEDSMISYNVEIRNTDAHRIIDLSTKKSINRGKPVRIGKHVWLGEGVRILKGVTVGDGAIIGTGSIVTKDVKKNTVVAGNPGKVIKENCCWER